MENRHHFQSMLKNNRYNSLYGDGMRHEKVQAIFMRYIIHFIGDLNTLHSSLPVRLYQHYDRNHFTSSPVRCHLRPHHRYELGHIPEKFKKSGYYNVVNVFQVSSDVLCMDRSALYRALGK